MHRPTTLPALLRTISLMGIGAWLAWQVTAAILDVLDAPWGLKLLALMIVLLTGVVWGIRQLRRSLTPGWRLSDGPVLGFFMLLLLFEGFAWHQDAPPQDLPVNIAPWSVDGVRPDDRRYARVLEAAWREQLWRQNAWQPVTWFLMDPDHPMPGGSIAPSLRLEDQNLTLFIREHQTGAGEPPIETLQAGRSSTGGATLVNAGIDTLNRRYESGPERETMTPGRQPRLIAEANIDCARTDRQEQDAALSELRDRVYREPESAISHVALASCILLIVRQRPDTDPALRHEARASANRALVLQPGLSDAQMTAAVVAWRFDRNAARAEPLWRQALDTFPHHAGLRLELAEMLFFTGQTDQAMLEMERARLTAPDHPRAFYLLGLQALERNNPDQAVQWLQAAVDIAPEAVEYQQALGLALERRGLDRNTS